MSLSLSNISAGAMTAAVTLGSTLQSVGASAAATMQALPTVAAGGLQAMGQGAATAASTLPQTLPGSVQAGAASTAQLATDLALVEKPAKAMAAAVPRASFLVRTAGFLSKALPIVSIGAGALLGARIVSDQGVTALLTTKDGRGAVLGAAGGALLLVPVPGAQLAAAGVLGAVAVNQFGGMDRLDDVKLGAKRVQPAAVTGQSTLQSAPPLA
jgi:hypothetical protein